MFLLRLYSPSSGSLCWLDLVSMTQAMVAWEEGPLTEKILPSDWLVGKSAGASS